MPTAYSYLRFSSAPQQWGDSARRQRDLATAYAAKHGLELADHRELADRGVSGYSGANLAPEAALGAFVAAVHSGHIERGSILLVESLDRLSRQSAYRAQHALSSIILAGITVVTLNDERVYNDEELGRDPLALLYAVVGFMRGHDESATKARRLREVWGEKRRKAASGEGHLTSRCPAWLRWDAEARAFIELPERSAVVRRIFADTLAGVGRHTIAQRLNAEGVASFGSSAFWRGTYIATVLRNSACMGELVPETHTRSETGKRVRTKADAVADYFPAVVTVETFQRVQSMLTKRGERGAVAPQRGRHVGTPIVNIFGGLMRCARCGAAVVVVNKGTNRARGQRVAVRSVVCERARTGGACSYASVRLDDLEAAFRSEITEIILAAPAGSKDGGAINAELATAEEAVNAAALAVDLAADAYTGTRSIALRERLRNAEDALDAAKRTRASVAERWAANAGPVLNMKVDQLAAAVSVIPFDKGAVNAALRQCFRAVVVDTDAETITLEWSQGGAAAIDYSAVADGEARERMDGRRRRAAERVASAKAGAIESAPPVTVDAP